MADGVAELEMSDKKAARPAGDRLSVEFRILDLFKAGNLFVLGPADVERAGIIGKGGASRILHALAQAGYLEELPNAHGRYAPGIGMWAISMSYMQTMIVNGGLLRQLLGDYLGKCQQMFQVMADMPLAHNPQSARSSPAVAGNPQSEGGPSCN